MRVLITGATGFIGKPILRYLIESGHRILAVTRRPVEELSKVESLEWLQGDLGELESLKDPIKDFAPEKVVHLGWQGIPDYGQACSMANLESSIDFLGFVLAETPCSTAIVAGSSFEYGTLRGECEESNVGSPNSYFSWAKQSLLKWLELKSNELGKKYIWCRIFFAYGPGQRSKSLIPTLVQAYSKGESPNIMNPFNSNDYVYVEDVAKAFLMVIQSDIISGVFNVGSGVPTSVHEICHIVEEIFTGKTLFADQMKARKNVSEQLNFWASLKKTKTVLEWMPHTGLEEGIRGYISSLDSLTKVAT
jgi:nucleoside-diphosphate-sugar epimerase